MLPKFLNYCKYFFGHLKKDISFCLDDLLSFFLLNGEGSEFLFVCLYIPGILSFSARPMANAFSSRLNGASKGIAHSWQAQSVLQF